MKPYILEGINQSVLQHFQLQPTQLINLIYSKSTGYFINSLIKYLFQLNDVKADYSQYDEPMTVSGNIIK